MAICFPESDDVNGRNGEVSRCTGPYLEGLFIETVISYLHRGHIPCYLLCCVTGHINLADFALSHHILFMVPGNIHVLSGHQNKSVWAGKDQ